MRKTALITGITGEESSYFSLNVHASREIG